MVKVYLSPSTQEANIGKGNYGTEERRMNEIVDLMVPMLNNSGVVVFRNKPSMSHIDAKNDSNRIGVDAHVAIHSDAGGGTGCTAFTSGSKEGYILANLLYREVSTITPGEDRGIRSTTDLTEVVKTNAPACLIEVSYHDNFDEAAWILANEKKIALALVKGICKYFNLPVKPLLTPEYVTYKLPMGAYEIKIIKL